MSDPAIKRLRRSVEDRKRAGGMTAGWPEVRVAVPEVRVAVPDAERILLMYDSIKGERDQYQQSAREESCVYARLQRAEELLKEARGFMDDITDVYGPGPDDCKSRIDAFLGEQS